MEVTGEKVKAAMIAHGINTVDHHPCAICEYMTRYIRRGDMLYFDAGCYCTNGNNLWGRSWEEAAEWINEQDPTDAPALAAKFGIVEVEAK